MFTRLTGRLAATTLSPTLSDPVDHLATCVASLINGQNDWLTRLSDACLHIAELHLVCFAWLLFS